MGEPVSETAAAAFGEGFDLIDRPDLEPCENAAPPRLAKHYLGFAKTMALIGQTFAEATT